MRFLLIVFGVIITLNTAFGYAQNHAYNINSPIVKSTDHAIIHDYSLKLNYQDDDKLIVCSKVIVTVFDEQGADCFHGMVSYSPDITIKDVRVLVLDEKGKKLRKIKKSKFRDIAIGDNEFYSDIRTLIPLIGYYKFPYTIILEKEFERKNIYGLPSWSPFPDYDVAVEKSTYEVTYPKGEELIIRKNLPASFADRYDLKCEEKIEEDMVTKSYSLSNLQSYSKDDYCQNDYDEFPRIDVILKNTIYHDVDFDFTSWKSYGKVLADFYNDTQELPKSFAEKVHHMVKDAATDKEKIEILYHYLQTNTRYVSIQLGLGGLKPFDAEKVVETGYGDCKALVNLMLAMLKEVGIKSYPAGIYSGRRYPKIDPLQPNPAVFNHVMLAVPSHSDTLWLECTNPEARCGEISAYNRDKTVLLLSEEGGVLVKTPKLGWSENCFSTKVEGTIDNEGNIDGSLLFKKTGLFRNMELGVMDAKTSKRKVSMGQDLLTCNVRLDHLSFIDTINSEGVSELSMQSDCQLKKQVKFMPDGLILDLGINKWSYARQKQSNPFLSVVYNIPEVHKDVIELNLPEQYKDLTYRKDVFNETTFGSVYMKIVLADGAVKVEREFKLNPGKYPPNQKPAFLSFYKQCLKYANYKVVVTRN